MSYTTHSLPPPYAYRWSILYCLYYPKQLGAKEWIEAFCNMREQGKI